MTLPTTLNVPEPTQFGFHARLGNNLLRLAATPDRQVVVDRAASSRSTVNTSENPEDFADEFGRTFSRVDFSGGGGLRFAHRTNNPPIASQMFWDSYGVQVDDEGQVSLLNDTEVIVDQADPTAPTRAAYDGTTLFWTIDSTDLQTATSLLSASPTLGTEATGAANNLVDVASQGGVVYVADGSEVRQDQGTGTWVQWSDLAATRVWATKNRIVASDGQSLYDDPSGTGPHTSMVDLIGSSVWVDVVDAGSHVLAASDDGYVYALAFDGTSLSLVAQSFFPQETPTAVGALRDVVAVTTSQANDDGTFTGRLWVGTLRDDGVLDDLAVVKEWDDLPGDGTPMVLDAPERDALYTATSDGTDSFLWRYDLEHAAVTRDLVYEGTPGFVTTIIKAEGRFWSWTDDAVVLRETNTRRATGWLVSPAVDFFTSESKTWASITVDGQFTNGGSLVLDASTLLDALDNPADDAYWSTTKTVSNPQDAVASLTLDTSRYIMLRINLTGGAVLKGFSLRALPPLADEVIRLPVNVSDHIARPGRSPVSIKGYGDAVWADLRALQGRSLELEVYALGVTWQGSVVELSTPVTALHPRGGVTRTMTMTFRGRVYPANAGVTGTYGLGTFGSGWFGNTEHTA